MADLRTKNYIETFSNEQESIIIERHYLFLTLLYFQKRFSPLPIERTKDHAASKSGTIITLVRRVVGTSHSNINLLLDYCASTKTLLNLKLGTNGSQQGLLILIN